MAVTYGMEPLPGGGFSASGTPHAPGYEYVIGARGLQLRGAVLRVYTSDAEDNRLSNATVTRNVPANRQAIYLTARGPRTQAPARRRVLYCDVFVYTSFRGMRFTLLERVLIPQPAGGLHTGTIWRPRATTKRLDLREGTRQINPADLDGDHVIVSFLDDDLAQPFVLANIPHPQSDVGQPASRRSLAVRTADDHPKITKHNGIEYGVTGEGNFVVDLVRANDGKTDDQGRAPRLPTEPVSVSNIEVPSTAGSVDITLRGGQTVRIRILDPDTPDDATKAAIFEITGSIVKIGPKADDAVVMHLAESGNRGALTLGDGSNAAAISQKLEALYTQLKTFLDSATVLTALGPSSPLLSTSPVPVTPPWDAAIQSHRLTFPED